MRYVRKGWGYEIWIANSDKYCGKLLFFNEGMKCSYHYHEKKDETFYLQSGRLLIYWSDEEDHPDDAFAFVMLPGQTFHIPPGRRHMMRALEDSELFEFSTEHFDYDSIRLMKGD